VNGETYTFGVKNNTFYYVAVVAVSNDGANLAEQYVGKEITATAYSREDANGEWVEGFTTV
ncbi:MAG: hypothetical protein K2N65_03140, partial [Anaeroplasmataceae bacterium]|nr:hypothetical protein [Anaeroplasmataceae bacterium]